MNKKLKLGYCDWALIIIGIVTLFTGIWLEITGGSPAWMVWLHIVVASLFIAGCVYHIYLHFGWNGWLKKFKGPKMKVNRILALFGVLTALTAVWATVDWLINFQHTTIGGVHGKLGYVFVAICIGHLIKRFPRLIKLFN